MKQIDYSDLLIKNVINFLTKKIIPSDLRRIQKFRFHNRFLSGHYSVRHNKLLYDLKPVVSLGEKKDIL